MSRFQYAVARSIVLHAIVLFGVTFGRRLTRLDNASPALEVVLVNSRRRPGRLRADAVAQHNLDGGGNTDLDRRASSPLPGRARISRHELTMESRRVRAARVEAQKLLTHVQGRQGRIGVSQRIGRPNPMRRATTADIMSKSLEIARLEARFPRTGTVSKRPRRQFCRRARQEFRFARYIEDWRQKIERVGTLNYPEAAKNHENLRSLQLTVSIKPDGSLDNIEINRSSGQKILDEAARRIVQLAAPTRRSPPTSSKTPYPQHHAYLDVYPRRPALHGVTVKWRVMTDRYAVVGNTVAQPH